MPKPLAHSYRVRFHVATVTGLIGFLLPFALSGPIAEAATHAQAQRHGTSTGGYSPSTPQSEATAITSAHWMSNVAVLVGQGSWTFRSNGLPPTDFVAPDYAVPNNPNAVSGVGARIMPSASILQDQNYDYTLPLTPAYTTHTTTTNLGPIGIGLDGAVFFNPYEANDSTVATADNFITKSGGVSASFLDDCDGHPGPHGQYHYHGLPACLADYATGQTVPAVASVKSTAGSKTAGVSLGTATAREPVLLGFAFDGFGIYDNISATGKTIPVSELDACNGIFSAVPGYSHGVYHYVLENIKSARADIGCYHGVVSSAYTLALQATLEGGNDLPGPGAPSLSNGVRSASPQSAYSLAANGNEDTFLRTVIDVSDHNFCG